MPMGVGYDITGENAFLTKARMVGSIFYVNLTGGGGSDSNSGTSPTSPLLKIETAVGKCTNDAGDFIFVMDCYDADTEPITINKSGCHIIGLSLPAPWKWAILNGGGEDVFQIDANYVEISGFGMVAAGDDGISIGNVGYGWLHDLSFAYAATGMTNGVVSSTGTPTSFLFEDNFIGGNAAACVTNNGVSGSLTDWIIRNNIFRYCGGKGISIGGGMNVGAILNNYFFSPEASSEGAGWAITLAAGCKTGIISGNRAGEGATQGGDNPYLDQSTNSATTLLNTWVDNMDFDTITAPDTA